ncbi:MAG: hypothetical protein HY721_12545 [Planctomycetes bacterium]|nr:hypothetical protein [Planctomycetota bacterium]
MKRVWFLPIALVAILTGVVSAQSTFSLGFSGPTLHSGNAGQAWSGDYNATLTSALADLVQPGAQGWSLSMSADNAEITAIAFEGSEAEGSFSGGFKKTELTTTAKAGSGCEGKNGAVSAIVLSFTEDRRLGAGAIGIAKITAGGTIPAGGGSARLLYVDGCRGAGQPVDNNITEAGATVKPELGALDITLKEIVSCCHSDVNKLNVGFSSSRISSASPYDGIIDPESDPAVCDGDGGEILVAVSEGAQGSASVYANISSQNAGGGAQGWSLAIAVGGEVTITSVTTNGTASAPAPEGLFSGGFNKTEAIDPAKPENGTDGVVSAIVLSFTEARNLPAMGTESVLVINLQEAAPQGAADQVGSAGFKSGLRGAGQPVQNAITVDGGTQKACNFDTASIDVRFQLFVPQIDRFVRGNANDDSKVNIADPIWIINELFRAGPKTACPDAADANDDGMIDSSDAVYLIEYQFMGGAEPSAPFPACGEDTTGGTPESCPAGSTASCE